MCNGFLPHSLRPSLHTEFTQHAMAFSLTPFRLPCSTCILLRVLAPLPFPRVHSDLDHCSLGTQVPPHLEASGDPETCVLGLMLTNHCSTPCQPLSPLRDQTSMLHAELARNAAYSLPYCTPSSLGAQRLVLALSEVFSSLTQPPPSASHDEFHTLPVGFSLPTLSVRLCDILQIT